MLTEHGFREREREKWSKRKGTSSQRQKKRERGCEGRKAEIESRKRTAERQSQPYIHDERKQGSY